MPGTLIPIYDLFRFGFHLFVNKCIEVAANTQKKPKLTLAGEKDKKWRMRNYSKSVDPSKPIIGKLLNMYKLESL